MIHVQAATNAIIQLIYIVEVGYIMCKHSKQHTHTHTNTHTHTHTHTHTTHTHTPHTHTWRSGKNAYAKLHASNSAKRIDLNGKIELAEEKNIDFAKWVGVLARAYFFRGRVMPGLWDYTTNFFTKSVLHHFDLPWGDGPGAAIHNYVR